MSLIKNAGTVGGLTLLSRLFGFVRDVMMAAILGAGPIADAFMVAFRLPNHFRAILAEGAFNSAFVPTYSAVQSEEGEEAARQFRSRILSWVLIVNLAVLVLALLGTGWLLYLLAPGLTDEPTQRQLVIDLTRITFPYLACLSVVSLLGGVLNAHSRFVAHAAAPILLNIAMTGTLAIGWLFPSAAHAAAWGVFIGGFAQLLALIIACRRNNIRFDLGWPKADAKIRVFLKRFGPAVLGASGVQIAMFADTIIATFLPSGSLSYLYYADRLYQLPLAVIGIAIGTAILPDLSRRWAKKDDRSAPTALGHAVTICLVLGLPCAIGLGLLGAPIIEILFARGNFTQVAVSGSAAALAAYAFGLPAAIAIRALVSGFHARGDTTTPVKALAIATIVNVGLKLLLVTPFLHAGLAAGTAVGVWIYAGLLAVWLYRDDKLAFARPDKSRSAAAIFGALVMVAAIMLLNDGLASALGGLPFAAILALVALGTISLVAFFLPLGINELRMRRHRRSSESA